MKNDETLNSIFVQIQKEVKVKFGKDISIEEIFNIVNSQIEATKEGLKRSITVHWIKFGKFLFTNRVVRKGKIYQTNELLDITEEYTPSEKEEIKRNSIIESAREKKYYSRISACDKNIAEKELKAEEVLNKEVVTTTQHKFKLISRKKT